MGEMTAFLTIEDAAARLYPEDKRPSVRTVRERMASEKCVIFQGRDCYTTAKLISKFKAIIECKATGQSSAQSLAARKRKTAKRKNTGSRAASSPSANPMALLPEDELRLALEVTRQRRGKEKSIASTRPMKTPLLTHR